MIAVDVLIVMCGQNSLYIILVSGVNVILMVMYRVSYDL